MIYVLAALLPPLGLLLNGQPFSAIFNLVLIVFCLVFGLIFHVLLLVPSAHALIVVHMKREDRRHREVVEAIRQHRPAETGQSALTGQKAGRRQRKACAWLANALIRRPAMLSTTANPTDGLRFDGNAFCVAEGPVHP
jgi:hypothetical protein